MQHHSLWVLTAALLLTATGSAQLTIGSVQCEGTPNSTGARARLSAFGDLDPLRNDLWLRAEGLPMQALACALVGRTGARVPLAGGGAGTLCLGSGFVRLSNQVVTSTSTGKAVLDIDLTALPSPMGGFAVVRGDTLRFQMWSSWTSTATATWSASRCCRSI